VQVNEPYSGGDLVRTFGRPVEGRNSLQIEINRRLYLDESTYEKNAGFDRLKTAMTAYTRALAGYARQHLAGA
jgi:N-formylglutamate deformylase